MNEDIIICHYLYEEMINKGIKFAPAKLAAKFSMENEFLQFDYIGAPWSNKVVINPNLVLDLKENPVGNGGFSLRSRKLVEATAKINFKSLKFPIKNEDLIICHYLYKKMLESDIHFAPPKLAAQFSIENENHLYGQDVNKVFGFHGKQFREYFLNKYILRETSETL